MPLPSSGAISLSQVNTELGVGATTTRSLNDTTTRNLFGVASGQISMSQGWGKANEFPFTISTSQIQADLRTLAVNAGWNGVSKVVATVASGVYIYSNSTGAAALTVSGSFPGGVQLINNGVIIGRGGNGGNGGSNGNVTSGVASGGPGSAGGLALSVSVALSITNNSIIAGGGGGGGAGGNAWAGNKTSGLGGAGGGGGIGNSSGGAGGTYGTSNTGPAGAGGTLTGAGAGGIAPTFTYKGGNGGNGGSYGSTGANGVNGSGYAGVSGAGGAGGAAGACTSGNANITWLALGSRYGALN